MSMADRIAVMSDGVLQQVGSPSRSLLVTNQSLRRPIRRQPNHECGRLHRGRHRFIDEGSFRRDAGSLPFWRRKRSVDLARPAETALRWACDPRPYWLSTRSGPGMSRQMFT